MRKLNTIDISPDGQTATIGGGALSKEVTDALWARGKQTDDMWQVYTFTYEGSNVEPVFEELNRFAKTTAHLPGIFYFSNFIRLPQIDTARPFEDIGPLDVKKHQSVTYPEIPSLTATGVDDFACLHGSSVILSPINIQEFNLEAQRAVFEVFTKVTGEVPELSNAFIMFEGYSLDGVKAVPEDSTAFAHRGDNIVISPAMMYSPNTSVDAIAIEATNKMRSILHEGAGGGELHTYVNYAFGNETLENMYGYGKWRLERLRGLKRAYDPFGRFNYYAPIS
ncbi:hypothetical protein M7I_3281 [Glarea lozoyensis 74030]|uniref:Uncharacterized protein n=1 Tax=Glarea lozoyensis (strain ATCC 74030 / MF5533) TaxID=1104152 RepID=H0EL45_GLAL7|nr:hypothetical protein M7I_3281 [Glarea lozoyensis 74030]